MLSLRSSLLKVSHYYNNYCIPLSTVLGNSTNTCIDANRNQGSQQAVAWMHALNMGLSCSRVAEGLRVRTEGCKELGVCRISLHFRVETYASQSIFCDAITTRSYTVGSRGCRFAICCFHKHHEAQTVGLPEQHRSIVGERTGINKHRKVCIEPVCHSLTLYMYVTWEGLSGPGKGSTSVCGISG